MIASLLKRGIVVAAIWLLQRYKQASLDLIKIRAAIYYVRGVQNARAVAIAVLIALGLLGVMTAGFLILPFGLALLLYGLTNSWVVPCVALLGMGALYVIVPLCILRRNYMNERAWMSVFKVENLVARVTRTTTTG